MGWVRWNKPEFTNEVIQKYRVQYWFIENLKKIQTNVDIIPANNKILQHKVFDLKFDTMYYFKVQAHNKVGGGPYTKFINVSTTHENPIPLLLIKSFMHIGVYDMDLQIRFALKKFIIKDYTEIVYSALEHQIYGINEKEELITCDFNLSAIETESNCTKIIDLSSDSSVCNLQIDWIARNLYWKQHNKDDEKNYIMKLDLTLWQQMGIAKYDKILQIDKFSLFLVLPSTGFLYWSEFISDERIIMQSDFDGKNIKPFLKNEDNKCFCPYKPLEDSTYMQIDNTNIDKPLIYWTSKDRLFATDIYNCKCNLILSAGNQTNFDYITIDKTNIYLYNEQKKIFYMLKKKDDLKSKENSFESVTKVCIQNSCPFFIYRSTALDKSLQSYPPTICLTPNMKDYHVEEVITNANSIVVSLPEPIPNNGCKKYNLATTIYTISVNYLTCLDNNLNKSEKFNVQTYKRHYEIQNLMPFTEYTLKLALSNFYFDKLSIGLQFGADVKLTTTGKLNAPGDVTVQVLTPTLAAVYWMPPKKLNCVAVKYEMASFS
ncbi:proto-oncogene tyrosine-protein kinase ros [Lasius niger]|uniref:Proto-oncogene tyrosine-protein kinase ros n=1 Tax=Lasius niger TaxID=67767 RepID=A0A0J7K2X2_LASNI|nr:proto-oncogene tyrosine-protein kinase ros [Lasius niger]